MWGIPYVTSEQGGGSAVKNYPKFADKQNKFCDQKGGKRVKKSLSSMDVRYGIPLREPSRAFQNFKMGALTYNLRQSIEIRRQDAAA